MAGHPDRQVGNDPVGAVFRDQRDVTALGQFPRTQPMGGAAGLMADVGPCQCLDLPAADGLNQKALSGMTGLTFVEDIQRQTKSSRHETRSLFLFWSSVANQASAWLAISYKIFHAASKPSAYKAKQRHYGCLMPASFIDPISSSSPLISASPAVPTFSGGYPAPCCR
jgi:hypothetical protein